MFIQFFNELRGMVPAQPFADLTLITGGGQYQHLAPSLGGTWPSLTANLLKLTNPCNLWVLRAYAAINSLISASPIKPNQAANKKPPEGGFYKILFQELCR